MIMGIDHGYYAMKTKQVCFPTGLMRYTYEPYTMQNVLQESMEKRTLAVQVTEELFQRVKWVVAKEGIKQKDFIIRIIEKAVEEVEAKWQGLEQPEETPEADRMEESTEETAEEEITGEEIEEMETAEEEPDDESFEASTELDEEETDPELPEDAEEEEELPEVEEETGEIA